ncbi:MULTISPECIES: EexN family lipoprotein [Pseudomonadota]|uniref:EexN family lipoprotein n=1 Tax=Pseudomonadota TaxID=1224 RepID=UPI0015631357|nr:MULTISPECIES: EexN family lipoprotein [Pseudomonadota]QKI75197.1 EexN family lipoprotein [Achromobacter xylosoxidans]
MKKVILPFLIPILVSACGDNTPAQTVDWYKAHASERKAMIAKCEANPGEFAASANCINAKTAANHLAVDKRGYPDLIPTNPLKGGQ